MCFIYVRLTAWKSFKPSGVTPDSRAVIMCCLRSTSSRTLFFNWKEENRMKWISYWETPFIKVTFKNLD